LKKEERKWVVAKDTTLPILLACLLAVVVFLVSLAVVNLAANPEFLRHGCFGPGGIGILGEPAPP